MYKYKKCIVLFESLRWNVFEFYIAHGNYRKQYENNNNSKPSSSFRCPLRLYTINFTNISTIYILHSPFKMWKNGTLGLNIKVNPIHKNISALSDHSQIYLRSPSCTMPLSREIGGLCGCTQGLTICEKIIIRNRWGVKMYHMSPDYRVGLLTYWRVIQKTQYK